MCDIQGLCGEYNAQYWLCVIYVIQKAFAGRMRPACQCLGHAGLDDIQKVAVNKA